MIYVSAVKEIAPNVFWLGFKVANVYFLGEKSEPWVVVDTNTPGHFEAIRAAAEDVYGAGAKPDAILLTHAHMDHYGSALPLASYWNVPVFVSKLDLPYVTGKELPPADPTTDGFFALAARFLPTSGVDLGNFVHTLPDDGSVPGLSDWRWVATPGHTPGHVSLFRESDRTLIAGDAVVTVNLDKLSDLVTQEQELSRPPTPVTYDWSPRAVLPGACETASPGDRFRARCPDGGGDAGIGPGRVCTGLHRSEVRTVCRGTGAF
jgi:glyoxylase-like metal-dependent hydrolase (beta-lactamase superfamily II)